MGKVGVFQEKAQINAYTMKHITSSNEVTHHLVSVAWAWAQGKQAMENPMGVKNLGFSSMGASNPTSSMSAGGMGGADDISASWTDVQKQVYKKIQEMQTDTTDCFIPNMAKQL